MSIAHLNRVNAPECFDSIFHFRWSAAFVSIGRISFALEEIRYALNHDDDVDDDINDD